MEFEFVFGPNQELLEVSRPLLDLCSADKQDFLKIPGIYPRIFRPAALPYAQKRFSLFRDIGPTLNKFLQTTPIMSEIDINDHIWQIASQITILGTKYFKGIYVLTRTIEPHPAGEILRMISPHLLS